MQLLSSIIVHLRRKRRRQLKIEIADTLSFHIKMFSLKCEHLICLKGLCESFTSLFDHRGVLQNEANHFVKEIEVKLRFLNFPRMNQSFSQFNIKRKE